jgi:hypothetical protein
MEVVSESDVFLLYCRWTRMVLGIKNLAATYIASCLNLFSIGKHCELKIFTTADAIGTLLIWWRQQLPNFSFPP